MQSFDNIYFKFKEIKKPTPQQLQDAVVSAAAKTSTSALLPLQATEILIETATQVASLAASNKAQKKSIMSRAPVNFP